MPSSSSQMVPVSISIDVRWDLQSYMGCMRVPYKNVSHYGLNMGMLATGQFLSHPVYGGRHSSQPAMVIENYQGRMVGINPRTRLLFLNGASSCPGGGLKPLAGSQRLSPFAPHETSITSVRRPCKTPRNKGETEKKLHEHIGQALHSKILCKLTTN